eukprot:GFUD01086509.1.p1 GENE.GFUD01086509.1~~GFUD01086509.1.p1  ORF type:complete len:296 (+),score=91.06 GFUD01086509.1:154-1041(+)
MFDVTPYVFGGIAAMCAEMVTFPIDTAKVRLQLQGQAGSTVWVQGRYRGTVHCLACMVREEGVTGVYKGLSPALLRQAVYGTIKFGLYYSAKELLAKRSGHKQESGLVNLGCAVFAGSVSSAIATPTDVIKVRMQSKSTEGLGGLYTVARDIYTVEGVRGLWRGVCPTAQRSALVAGVQLPVYDLTKSRLCCGPSALMRDGVVCHFLSSLVAGFSAALASNPVDVVRTRLMVQRRCARLAGGGKTTVYSSAIHCGLHTVRTEGFSALFKGFVPSFARMGPWNVIFFVVYEKLKRL